MGAIVTRGNFVNGTIAAGTSHFGIGGDASLVQGVHFKWDATLIAVITIWECHFDPVDVAVNSVTAGDWIQLQPTTRYVAISPAGAATESNLTVTIPGGTAGGCIIDIGNFSGQRLKAQVVVTTPGVLLGHAGGKQ